jgi:hypothetical protein
LIIEGGPARPLSGPPGQRQYYGVIDCDFGLVRVEDEGERCLPLSYVGGQGPAPLPKLLTVEDVIGFLENESQLKQLHALVWLSGVHEPLTARRHANVAHEPLESVQLHAACISDPRVHSAVDQLRTSRSRWVREYAEMAIKITKPHEAKGQAIPE